jgi:hypothetical protein
MLMAPCALASVQDSVAATEEEQWVLQLGFFSRLNNALNFQRMLAEAGFEASVVSTGEPGEQHYRVISGRATAPENLEALSQSIHRHTGTRGFAVENPFASESVEEVFDIPESRYVLAQASSPDAVDGPMRASGYDPMLSRTPQGEIDSMPGFTLGGFQIMPTLGLSLGYDDNITSANSHEVSSMFYMISPAIRVELPSDHSVLALTAQANIVRYEDSPVDNRDTWQVRGDWLWDISTRQNLNLFVAYTDGVDERGEGRRQGDAGLIPLEPDAWERWSYGGIWDYGRVSARGRLTLKAGETDLTYTNNRGSGAPDNPGTRALDRELRYFGGTFYWRVAPKTSLLLDYLFNEVNYKLAADSDSEIQSWMLGVTWDATARTSGRIQYGNQTRDFIDPGKESYDGPTWMATVEWRPRTYSMFTLTGTRNTQEPDGNGDYILRQDITLSWLHDWATRFGTFVDLGYGQDDFRPDGRKDDLFYWGVGARYSFNQHFRFGASITGYHRDSEIEQYSFDRMVYLLTAEAGF